MKGILKHDGYAGLLGNWKIFIIITFLFYIMGFFTIKNGTYCGLENVYFWENVIVNFSGCVPCFNPMQSGANFSLPIQWMVLQVLIAYLIGSYPLYDLQNYGINLLVRVKSREKWWLGKVIWTIESVIMVYFIGYLILGYITLVSGGRFDEVRIEASALLFADYSVFNQIGILMIAVVMPMLTSITVSFLQLLLTFCFDSVVAFAIIFFILIISVFYAGPIWIYENGMGIRLYELVINGSFIERMIGMIIVDVAIIVIGCLVMKYRDIFGND